MAQTIAELKAEVSELKDAFLWFICYEGGVGYATLHEIVESYRKFEEDEKPKP